MTNLPVRYLATINTPGYQPWDDDPPLFEEAREAWDYLAQERRDAEDEAIMMAEEPEDVPEGYTVTVNILEQLARGEDVIGLTGVDTSEENLTGSVGGESPGYEGNHDLGLVYTVTEVQPAGEFKPAEGELLRLLTADDLTEEEEAYVPAVLDTDMRDGQLYVFIPAHDYPNPSTHGGGTYICRNCGLLPLDWDSIETVCHWQI